MDGVNKIRIRKASYRRDNGTLEIAMFTACHLADVRYSIEVTDADSLVLDTVTHIMYLLCPVLHGHPKVKIGRVSRASGR